MRFFGIISIYPFFSNAPTVSGAPFFCNGAVFADHFDVPTVIVGPGNPAVAHQADEYCDVTRLNESLQIYAQIIQEWC